MSKKTFLLVFLVSGIFLNSYAQITLTLNEIQSFFAVGQKDYVFVNSVNGSFDIGVPGENSWDFSKLQFGAPVECDVLDPKATSYWQDFHYHTSYVTLKMMEPDKTTYQYLCHYSRLKEHGFVEVPGNDTTNVIKTYYDPAKTTLRLPITYAYTFIDTVKKTVNVETNGVVTSSDSVTLITSSKADAYGTVKLPTGSSVEALRIRMEEVHTSETSVDTLIVYRWFTATGETFTVMTDDKSNSGTINVKGNITFVSNTSVTDIYEEKPVPVKFDLLQNYPNPFNPSTRIDYSVAEDSFVELKIFNTIGRQVASLENKWRPAGKYSVKFNAGNLSSGIYFVKMIAGKFNKMMKITLIK